METFSALLAICAGNSPHKGQWRRRRALMFSLICVWINGWLNNREAGDLRRYHPLWHHCNDTDVDFDILLWYSLAWKKQPSCYDWRVQMVFLDIWNGYFDSNVINVCLMDNKWTLFRKLAWCCLTNDGPVHWCIYNSPNLTELTHWPLGDLTTISN